MTIILGGFFRCLHANLDAASLLHLELQELQRPMSYMCVVSSTSGACGDVLL